MVDHFNMIMQLKRNIVHCVTLLIWIFCWKTLIVQGESKESKPQSSVINSSDIDCFLPHDALVVQSVVFGIAIVSRMSVCPPSIRNVDVLWTTWTSRLG